MNTPSAASVREWPGIALTLVFPSAVLVYLPIRGPRIFAPISADTPPSHVDGRRTGEIHKAQLGEPAAAPDPVRLNRVNNQGYHQAVKAIGGNLVRSAIAPETIVAAVAQNTRLKKNRFQFSVENVPKGLTGVPIKPPISVPHKSP